MTDQLFVFSCRDVRKYAFDFRRGELHDAEKRKFTEHVDRCEKCRDYVDRIEGMLDAAATHDFGEGIDRDRLFDRVVEAARDHAAAEETPDDAEAVEERLDRDRLFDRITEEISTEAEKPSEEPVVRLGQYRDGPESGVEEESEETGRSSMPVYLVAALAAGVLIGLALPYALRDDTPTTEVIAQDDEDEETTSPERSEPPAAEEPPVRLADLALQPTPSHIDDVRVFGEPRANWAVRSQGARRQLELTSGTVLVEFVPRAGHELELVTDRFEVRVTGTIFYVSADRGAVGVVKGSVAVETPDGETVELTDGQEWVDGSGRRRADPEILEDAARHVDVEQHQLALREAAEARPPPDEPAPVEAPRPPMSKEVVQTPTDALRASADRALREGRYEVAAQYYERMVEEFSAADPANASLRLDLSRIYIRHLDQPGRAMVHLRRFVVDRPDDPATPSAREELCRIVDRTGREEPLCDG